MFELSPSSQEDLDAFCEGLSAKQAKYLRDVVGRVLADPSGRRQPHHRYTKAFPNAAEYVPNLRADTKVWELKTNHYRALFTTTEIVVEGETHRLIVFVPVNGRRFMHTSDAPWH